MNAILRWVEFVGLFVGVPLALALLLPPNAMWATLAGMTFVGFVLLHRQDGFSWRDLLVNARPDWKVLIGFTLIMAGIAVVLVHWLVPARFLELPTRATGMWLMIMLLYPLVSALPQEVIFRALFFRRYGDLMPRWALIPVNGVLFSLAHLMYWNGPALALTFLGGIVFSWAYYVRGSFMMAFLLHAIAGQIIFTTGLGVFFYHGAV